MQIVEDAVPRRGAVPCTFFEQFIGPVRTASSMASSP
jgi:hypothetical protein